MAGWQDFGWLSTVPGTPNPANRYDRLERLYKINKQPENYSYAELERALDRGTSSSWRSDPAGQGFVSDWLARRQDAINKKKASAPAPQPKPLPAAPVNPPPAEPSPDPGWSGGGSNDSAGGGGSNKGGSKSPYDFSSVLGMTPAEFDLEADLARIREQGNINTTIQKMITQSNNYIARIQGRSAVKVADISAGATKFSANRQKEATMYVADREKETALGVEDIRAKGALDLQEIVNAGLIRVEKIRRDTAKDVTTIGGEFDVRTEKIRRDTAKDVAKIDRDKGIYGSLISAFSFS